MSATETQEVLLETEAGTSDGDSAKLVPVAESIRYRKRAQGAEKKAEALAEQLAEAKSQASKMSEQLENIQAEQKLMRKLAAAGTVDLETAVLTAKARIEDQPEANMDDVIEQLRRKAISVCKCRRGCNCKKDRSCQGANAKQPHNP